MSQTLRDPREIIREEMTMHGVITAALADGPLTVPQIARQVAAEGASRVVVVTDAQGNDAFAVRPMIYLSLVFDHRILDGAGADAFLTHVKQALERWS